MLRGNQRGITIFIFFHAGSFALGWVPGIGSQREWRFYEPILTRTHLRGHKVAFTVGILILGG